MAGFNYYALDNGYFRRGKYFRVTKNGYTQTIVVDRPADRWNALGIKLKDPRRGSEVMLALSTPHCYEYFECPTWPQDTLAELKKHTDRKIRVREKVIYREIDPDDLKNVWCVVTHSSAIALDALIAGVPAIVTGPGAASICEKDLSKIEEVTLPDNREKLMRSLAYAQWGVGEFALAKKVCDELNAEYDHL